MAASSALAWFSMCGVALAQDSLWDQPSIFDVPGGPKQGLKEVGIDLSVYYTEFYQGLVSGEGDKTWEFGGKAFKPVGPASGDHHVGTSGMQHTGEAHA